MGDGMSDDRHNCPAPGCHHRVPFDRFACKNHWFTIPQLLRARLWREWDENPGGDSYFAVRAECLAALGVPVDEIADANGGVSLGGNR
jgi:hypothetical protein